MGGVKTFINIDVDEEGNEIEEVSNNYEDDDVATTSNDTASNDNSNSTDKLIQQME